MYCELFGLKEPPFRLTPDPQFLFASKQHSRAKAYMESTIWLADGFVVITGDIGSGKTTLIESFLSELGDDVVIGHVNQTQLSPVEFLQALLVEFGFKPFKMQKIELLTMLRDYMIEQYAADKKLLLVVDEAQNLSRQVLEEIRMLSGIEAQKEKLLRIILAGQPELAAKLDSPKLEQLAQRVRLRFHLGSLSKRETREYIEHRLRVAGSGDRAIFTNDAFDVVFRYSGGVPRLTNVICDTAMLCAFAEERDTVDASLVKAAAEELQWIEYAERLRSREHRDSTGEHPRVAHLPSVDLLFRDEVVSHHVLPPGRAIIGRTPDNDVQIQSKFISRHHAQIVTYRGRSVIEDLNSTNGIFLGARRVKHHVLADGDVVQIGEHTLVFRDRGQASGPTERRDSDRSADDLVGVDTLDGTEDMDDVLDAGAEGGAAAGLEVGVDDAEIESPEEARDEEDASEPAPAKLGRAGSSS
ncbi:MAG TPA: AAA family ATPase [Gammaproteobacteria bacterium]|nr:AAA family ATPase [Gammaproteobacteria bacterium]